MMPSPYDRLRQPRRVPEEALPTQAPPLMQAPPLQWLPPEQEDGAENLGADIGTIASKLNDYLKNRRTSVYGDVAASVLPNAV